MVGFAQLLSPSILLLLRLLLRLFFFLVIVIPAPEVVQKNGQEKIQDDVVPNDDQQQKVQRGEVGSASDSIVHHRIPVLASEDLEYGDDGPEDIIEVVPRDVHLAQPGQVFELVHVNLAIEGFKPRRVGIVYRVFHTQAHGPFLGPLHPPAVDGQVRLSARSVAVSVLRTTLSFGADGSRPRRVAVAELERIPKELHPQERENEHEQQKDQAEVCDAR
mmetsp:Transcript_32066/g.53880  ORF Transcript_32066/g.53880 Transcript_32066/m.53880 type:complete len:218 (-) Transcript_32066:2250-2903(-)